MPEYLNHVMGCNRCFAPAKRHCDVGKQLRDESAAYYVVSRETLKERRQVMKWLEKTRSESIENIKILATKFFEEKRQNETTR